MGEYTALMYGQLPTDVQGGRVDHDVIRADRGGTQCYCVGRGQPARGFKRSQAVSNYQVIAILREQHAVDPLTFTLLKVHIETGATHQIRLHVKAIAQEHGVMPIIGIVGDTLYVEPKRPRCPLPHQRLFLHEHKLELETRSGVQLRLRCPLPPDLVAVLGAMRPVRITEPELWE